MDALAKALRLPPKAQRGGAGDNEVREELLRPIKEACRRDAQVIPELARCLLHDVQRKNVSLRMKCLAVIDALFTRSQKFRESVCMQGGIRIIARSAGLLHDEQQAGNEAAAALETNELIKERVKELVEVWDLAFGLRYPALHSVARYFRESLRLVMPNVAARAQQFASDRRRREEEALRLLLTKRDRVLRDARADLGEIETNLRRLENCFSVLFPAFDDILGPAEDEGALGGGGGGRGAEVGAAQQHVWVQDGEELGPVSAAGDEEEDDGGGEGGGGGGGAQRCTRPRLGDEIGGDQQGDEEDETAWQDASDDDGDDDGGGGGSQRKARPALLAQAPGILELQMRSGLHRLVPGEAQGSGPLGAPEHEAVVQVMRELCRYQARHALPLLADWQTVLSQAIALPASQAGAGAATGAGAGAVLRRVALLRAAARKLLLRCRDVFDQDTIDLLRQLGEDALIAPLLRP